MKNISLFTTLLLFTACNSPNKIQQKDICTKSNWEAMELNGHVKRLENHWYMDPDSLEKGWWNVYEFNEEGYTTWSSFIVDGQVQRENNIVRNDRKEIVKITVSNHIADKQYKLIYVYKECNITDIKGFLPDDINRFDHRKFKYDSLGRRIETTEFLDGDIMQTRLKIYKENGSYETKSYNQNKRLKHRYNYQTTEVANKIYTSNMNYFADHDTNQIDPFDSTFYEYDQHGNMTSSLSYINGKAYSHQFFYTYDSLDNWIKYEDHQDSALWQIHTRKIVYY